MENVAGSKLTTEFWNGSEDKYEDWNHAWSTSPINILTRYIIGIRPKTPGFGTAIFDPKWGDLKNVSAKIPIRSGSIKVNYKRKNKDIEIIVCVPQDSKIDYYKPTDAVNGIMIDNNVSNDPENILDPGEHIIKYLSGN